MTSMHEFAKLPLAERAPEVGQLLARLGPGEWGADQLGVLADWFTDHGYDLDEDDDNATCVDCGAGPGEPCTWPCSSNVDRAACPHGGLLLSTDPDIYDCIHGCGDAQ